MLLSGAIYVLIIFFWLAEPTESLLEFRLTLDVLSFRSVSSSNFLIDDNISMESLGLF